ncbi:MAG: DUF1674 domain-containing protein [Rhodospirillaceae bacterium]|nr:DUF1674 domain-containing protein [Rhodospirillaceae bacterium]
MTNTENSPFAEPKTPFGSDTTSQPKAEKKTESEAPKPDSTRYGDWEKGDRCIDF